MRESEPNDFGRNPGDRDKLAPLPRPASLEPQSPPAGGSAPLRRPNRVRIALAIGVAAVSDALAFVVDLLPPAEWALDLATAGLLFLILGRRWALLPGLVAEAIPGLAIFPFWILVVFSILLYDDIRSRRSPRSNPLCG